MQLGDILLYRRSAAVQHCNASICWSAMCAGGWGGGAWGGGSQLCYLLAHAPQLAAATTKYSSQIFLLMVNLCCCVCCCNHHPGPNRNESEWKECVDKSVRIGLTIHPDGRHVFDDNWVVSNPSSSSSSSKSSESSSSDVNITILQLLWLCGPCHVSMCELVAQLAGLARHTHRSHALTLKAIEAQHFNADVLYPCRLAMLCPFDTCRLSRCQGPGVSLMVCCCPTDTSSCWEDRRYGVLLSGRSLERL
jgi:hypothetical protein